MQDLSVLLLTEEQLRGTNNLIHWIYEPVYIYRPLILLYIYIYLRQYRVNLSNYSYYTIYTS